MDVFRAGVPVIACQKDKEVIVTVSLRWWFDYFTYGWLGDHNRPMGQVVRIWAGLVKSGVPPHAWLQGGRGVEIK